MNNDYRNNNIFESVFTNAATGGVRGGCLFFMFYLVLHERELEIKQNIKCRELVPEI